MDDFTFFDNSSGLLQSQCVPVDNCRGRAEGGRARYSSVECEHCPIVAHLTPGTVQECVNREMIKTRGTLYNVLRTIYPCTQ